MKTGLEPNEKKKKKSEKMKFCSLRGEWIYLQGKLLFPLEKTPSQTGLVCIKVNRKTKVYSL